MLNVLLTSVGRRVSLVKFFKEALGRRGRVYTVDCDSTAPGLYVADKSFIVPQISDNAYIPFLLEKCKIENIKLIVPLIDPELPVLAKERDLFLKEGIVPLISTYDVVKIGYDKILTAKFFKEIGIPTPKTFLYREDLDLSNMDFPIIIKPRFGSASIGVQKCENIQDVKFYSSKISEPILQEFLKGDEITVDVLCDFDGNLISMVQRKRLKIRAGEVERGITIKNKELFILVEEIIKNLKPIGVINIQCFLSKEGFFFTEINPRFGGGYPLSFYAGANFPKMIIDILEGLKIRSKSFDYKEGLLMLRYDEAIYIENSNLLS